MNNFINALKEVKKENKGFVLTLSKKEVLEIVNEFDRLNNIINELEKWLEEETRLSDEIPDTLEHSDYTDVLDKLKELKEGNK